MKKKLFIVLVLAVLTASFTACKSGRMERAARDVPIGPAYEPENVFAVEVLPDEVQRVAVLPFTSPPAGNNGTIEDLHTAFLRELQRQGRFEVFPVNEELLRALANTDRISVVDDFPAEVLEVLRERYRADAVMVTDITAYRPYKPLAVGVRAKLFDARSADVLWACDEMIDAGRSTVNTGARRYARTHVKQNHPMQSTGTILQSPSRFSSYSADLIYGTLPPRG